MSLVSQQPTPPGKKTIRELFSRFRVSRPLAVLLGILTGLSLYTTYASNAFSYLSDDPKTCVNCHVMGTYYATYAHSSHRNVANCNDCHVPHTSVFAKYFFKAKDGLYHSSVFTLRGEPQAMMIKEAGANVVQENCLRCHGELNSVVAPGPPITLAGKQHGEGHLCWDCHRDVPHGTVRSLSSTPDAIVPYPESPLPEWIRNLRSEKASSNNNQPSAN